MRRLTLVALALFVLAAIPALAGGEHKKCPYTTQECLDKMAAKMKDSGWVGIDMNVDETTGNWTITKVFPGSPAEAAGIQVGDVLHSLNGVEFAKENEQALKNASKDWKPGQKVTYGVKRSGADRQVELTLARWPADILAGYIGTHMLEHVNSQIAQDTKKK
jgi:S1-C subfamily serine protease